MRLPVRTLTALLALAGALSLASFALAAAGGPATASLAACHNDPAQAARYATFAARMVEVPGATQMAVRFELAARAPGGALTPIAAPGFGVWELSAPGVAIYRTNQVVTDLPAPLSLRAVVAFRWTTATHRIVRRAVAITPTCVVRLLQADLQVASIVHRAASARYRVIVRNAGPAAAGPFAVSVALGGVALPAVQVPQLAAGARVALTVSGPQCTAGQKISATADSANAIVEPADPARSASAVCAG